MSYHSDLLSRPPIIENNVFEADIIRSILFDMVHIQLSRGLERMLIGRTFHNSSGYILSSTSTTSSSIFRRLWTKKLPSHIQWKTSQTFNFPYLKIQFWKRTTRLLARISTHPSSLAATDRLQPMLSG